MTYFIGDISALYYLLVNVKSNGRLLDGFQAPFPKPTSRTPQAGAYPGVFGLRDLGLPCGLTEGPLHINVAQAADRVRAPEFICHVWPTQAKGTYLKIDETYCVLSPEGCFMQMAGRLDFVHLVELGYLLCGTYCPESINWISEHYGLAPLTNVDKLRRYVERCKGKQGHRRASSALRYVLEMSASPMETKFAMAAQLPPRYGGYGAPRPMLNKELELDARLSSISWGSVRKPDLLWEEFSFAVEYNGSDFHDARRDNFRHNELGGLGLKLLIATSETAYNFNRYSALMEQIRANVGPKRDSRAKDLARKRYALWLELFGPLRWELGSKSEARFGKGCGLVAAR